MKFIVGLIIAALLAFGGWYAYQNYFMDTDNLTVSGREDSLRDAPSPSTGEVAVPEESIKSDPIPADPADYPVRSDEPMNVGGSVSAPVFTKKVDPVYTEAAVKARLQGVVIVQATIDRKGRVVDAKILKGLPMGLDQAALDAVKAYEAEPAMADGRPVSVYYNLSVNFRLQ